MWFVTDSRTGQPVRAQPLSVEELLTAARNRGMAEAILQLTALDDNRLVRVIQAIPTWLANPEDFGAAGEFRRLAGRELTGIFLISPPNSELEFDIALDDEIVVVQKPDDTADLSFEYRSPEDEALDIGQVPWRAPVFQRLELFAVVGTNSTHIEGSLPLRQSGILKRALAHIGFGSAIVVGRVVRFSFGRKEQGQKDPFMRSRLDYLEGQDRTLDGLVPRLIPPPKWDQSYLPPSQDKELVVLVHGTMSSGMRVAADLYPPAERIAAPIHERRVFRFEHDTFLQCGENARSLVSLVRPLADRLPRLLLIGHSRGGLVAADAAVSLLKSGSSFRSISLHTFGTPHSGTPLVKAGMSVAASMEALLRAGMNVAAQWLKAEPIGWAAGYGLGRLLSFPEGIADLKERSGYLRAAENWDFTRAAEARAWGARFDPSAKDASGFLHAWSLGFKKGFFDEGNPAHVPNDGVVPTQSAQPLDRDLDLPGALENCDHSAYFDRLGPELRDRIQAGR